MQKNIPHTGYYRFRKWSRKSYAVFSGLGKQITIGCLHKNVADSSLKKHKTGLTCLSFSPVCCTSDTDDFLSFFSDDIGKEQFTTISKYASTQPKQTPRALVSDEACLITNIKSMRREYPPTRSILFFYYPNV